MKEKSKRVQYYFSIEFPSIYTEQACPKVAKINTNYYPLPLSPSFYLFFFLTSEDKVLKSLISAISGDQMFPQGQ